MNDICFLSFPSIHEAQETVSEKERARQREPKMY